MTPCEGDCSDADASINPGPGRDLGSTARDSDCDGAENPDPCDEPPPAAVGGTRT